MPTNRDQHGAKVLQTFLKTLPDRGNAADPAMPTIEDKARDWDIAAEDLKAYREGDTSRIAPNHALALARLLGTGIDVDLIGQDVWGDVAGWGFGWYQRQVDAVQQATRNQRYDLYDQIDQDTRPEAKGALDAWADLAVTGSVGEDVRHTGGFEPELDPRHGQEIKELMGREARHLNSFIIPEESKLLIHRGMVKYGSQWGEIGYAVLNGMWRIAALRPRHCRTMYHHREEDGSINPERAYKQIIKPGGGDNDATFFAMHEIACFQNLQNWGDVDGTSIFQPMLRSYVQIEAQEASLIVRRLERASMKYKRTIDVSGCDGPDHILDTVKKYRDSVRKKLTVDTNRSLSMQRINPPAGEDEIVAKRTVDSPANVEVLEGDSHMDTIADITEVTLPKWFSGLGPPKAHVGWEGGTQRSVITDLHIVFARKVRRLQLKFIQTLNQLYWISLMLRGVDPRTVRFTIFPPSLGTRDELIRAQVQLLHATTTKYLYDAFGMTGKAPDPKWALKYIMGLDEEAITSLDLVEVIQPAGKGGKGVVGRNARTNKSAPRESAGILAITGRQEADREGKAIADAAMTNPTILEQQEHLQFMLDERGLSLRKEDSKAVREVRLYTRAPAWGINFEDVRRQMLGRRPLKDGGFDYLTGLVRECA